MADFSRSALTKCTANPLRVLVRFGSEAQSAEQVFGAHSGVECSLARAPITIA